MTSLFDGTSVKAIANEPHERLQPSLQTWLEAWLSDAEPDLDRIWRAGMLVGMAGQEGIDAALEPWARDPARSRLAAAFLSGYWPNPIPVHVPWIRRLLDTAPPVEVDDAPYLALRAALLRNTPLPSRLATEIRECLASAVASLQARGEKTRAEYLAEVLA
ncbi:MAG: hypothetical protein ACYCW6_13370 [Candidatus Xenobia bacterium]